MSTLLSFGFGHVREKDLNFYITYLRLHFGKFSPKGIEQSNYLKKTLIETF